MRQPLATCIACGVKGPPSSHSCTTSKHQRMLDLYGSWGSQLVRCARHCAMGSALRVHVLAETCTLLFALEFMSVMPEVRRH